MENRIQTVAAVLSLALGILSWNWRAVPVPSDPGEAMEVESFDVDGEVWLRIGEHDYRMSAVDAEEVACGLALSADSAREHTGKD